MLDKNQGSPRGGRSSDERPGRLNVGYDREPEQPGTTAPERDETHGDSVADYFAKSSVRVGFWKFDGP